MLVEKSPFHDMSSSAYLEGDPFNSYGTGSIHGLTLPQRHFLLLFIYYPQGAVVVAVTCGPFRNLGCRIMMDLLMQEGCVFHQPWLVRFLWMT